MDCSFCSQPIVRLDLIEDRPYWAEVGPCCSDWCSITRRHNTPEWGGVA